MVTYEDKREVIDGLLASREKKWKDYCSSHKISYMNYQDVCQIIRLHFYNKIDQYDPKQPFENWANRIISNQFKNISQNHYGKYAPPCVSPKMCGNNEGGGLCSKTKSKTQCAECPLYAKWEKKKQIGYNIQFAGSTEHESFEFHQGEIDSSRSVDEEASINSFHQKMFESLPEKLKQLYQWVCVERVTDEELAALMQLKTTEKGRIAGYRQVTNIRRDLLKRGRRIMEDFDFIEQ